jgi:hypothetical protein
MPEYKNQHYVPQHYLKGWAEDKKISIYHIEDGPIPVKTSISKVCSEDYLYGNATHVEKELQNIEELHQGPLDTLRNGYHLTELNRRERLLLLSFIGTQRTRHKLVRADIDAGDEILREGFREDMEDGVYDERFEWKDHVDGVDDKEESLVDAASLGIHLNMMLKGIFGFFIFGDLDGVMLRNSANEEFIISDTPIVLNNPAFRSSGGAGLVESGLQIYCPIDSQRVLFLYDPKTYSVDSNHRDQVLLKSQGAVDEVNLMQFHNAEDIVLHDSCSEDYLDSLAERMDEYRSRETYIKEIEIEGEVEEVPSTPSHQVPTKSPDISGCTQQNTWYTEEREGTRLKEMEEVVDSIYRDSFGAADIAIILAIRRVNEYVSSFEER